MKPFTLKTILFLLFLAPSVALGQIYEPEGVNMPGQWNGWVNSNDAGTMGNFRMAQRDFGGSQYLTTIEIASSGGDTTAGTYEMLFTSGPDANIYANKWADGSLTIDGFTSLSYQGSANNTVTVENGYYYTFILDDNGYQNTSASVLKTSAEPVSIASVSGVPSESVPENDPVTVTVELDKAKSPEEKIYIRYSSDGFTTSDAVEITNFSGGTTGSADIPGQPVNSSVDFYVLSTTIDKASWGGNTDLATISFDNNEGANYTYFYEANIQPLNGAESVELSPELVWYSIDGATGYDLQLDNDSDFSSPVADESSLGDTTYTVSGTLDINTTYYWRFRSDAETTWSNEFSFTTESEITFANIQFPDSAVIDEGNALTIYGQLTVPGVTSQSGASEEISAWLGISDSDTDPSTWAEENWEPAEYNEDKSSTDEYKAATGSGLAPGDYYYAYRYQYKDKSYVYGGTGGTWDGSTHLSGELAVLEVPVLSSPANAADGVSTEPELSWTSSDPQIVEYNLQVAEEATFSAPVIDEDGLSSASTSYQVAEGILNNEETYFWRVRAEYDTTAGGWSDTFSFTTVPDLPGKITLSSPADAAQDITLQPSLSWNPDNAADSYSLQVATSDGFTAPALVLNKASLTATQFDFDDSNELDAAGTYYWRVQGVNGTGTGPWSDTLSFTTSVIVPSLLAPADEEADLPQSAELSWNSIPGALNYDMQLSESSSFSTIVMDSSAHPDTVLTTPELELNTSYYWRVRANYYSQTSEWSTARLFTVKDAPPLVPELVSPDSGSVDIGLSPLLDWNEAADAESYDVQLSTVPDFSSGLVVDSTGTALTELQAPGLDRNITYYWRVRAFNTAGGYSDWSAVFEFKTIPEPPAAFELLSPADSASDLPNQITFTWNTSERAEHYRFQFSDQPDFNFNADSTLADTSLTLDGFEAGSAYYWRVQASNAGGSAGWSDTLYFETGVGGFAGPRLRAPEHNAAGTATEIDFSWTGVNGADSYRLQVTDSASFARDTAGITGTSLTLNSLGKGTAYFWRVRAEDSRGESHWSDTYSFSTRLEKPGVPAPAAPADSAADLSKPVTFEWNPAARAGSYELRLSEQPDFALATDSAGIVDTSLTLSSLSHDTRYYWQVRASNSGGKSAWSPVQTFTVIIDLPGIPEPVNPEAGEEVSRPVRLAWNKPANAKSYVLQLSEDESFETLAVDSSSITGLKLELDGLAENTSYFWRVRAENRAGAGAWSDTLNFTTQASTSLEEDFIPDEFVLHQNYPNPFNPATTIRYDVKEAGEVRIRVFDITGRLIRTLVNDRKPAGRYEVRFDAADLSSGVYLVRMQTQDYLKVRKMTLIK